ncbi:hypothetical protein C7S15_7722 [Burkholderia cepacia]|nr:hypothetical protein [Burkholderia cepacia]
MVEAEATPSTRWRQNISPHPDLPAGMCNAPGGPNSVAISQN